MGMVLVLVLVVLVVLVMEAEGAGVLGWMEMGMLGWCYSFIGFRFPGLRVF